MLRLTTACLALSLAATAPARQTADDRVKTLEAENRQLRDEVQALRQRLQALETKGAPVAAPAAPPAGPAATNDPGANPWGNPEAIRRTIAQALRENLQARGVAVADDSSGDAKAATAYRNEVQRWWGECVRMRRYRQAVTWPIEILEVIVASNTGTREYDITAYALNDAGARVGRWFVIRCPASAVPNLNPLQAAGPWTLRAEVQPEVTVISQGGPAQNVFRQRDLIAPQVECALRFSVASLEPTAAPGAETAPKGKPTAPATR